MTVRERQEGEIETQVDLETLFNAVVANPERFAAALGAKGGRS